MNEQQPQPSQYSTHIHDINDVGGTSHLPLHLNHDIEQNNNMNDMQQYLCSQPPPLVPQQQQPQQHQQHNGDNSSHLFIGRDDDLGGEPSSLDHALLESLFYNEMALLPVDTITTNNDGNNSDEALTFLSHHFAEATNNNNFNTTAAAAPTTTAATTTILATTEKETLRDFGVSTPQRLAVRDTIGGTSTATVPLNDHVTMTDTDTVLWQNPQLQMHTHSNQSVGIPSSSAFMQPHHPYPISTLHFPVPAPVLAHQQHHQQQLQNPHSHSYPTLLHYTNDTVSEPSTTQPNVICPQYPIEMKTRTTLVASTQSENVVPQDYPNATATPEPYTTSVNSSSPSLLPHPFPLNEEPLTTTTSVPPSQQKQHVVQYQDRAGKLVDQFTTLASRLGIDLPDTVLQSLTEAAAKNDPPFVMIPQTQQHQTPPNLTNSSNHPSNIVGIASTATAATAYNQERRTLSVPSNSNHGPTTTTTAQDENAKNGSSNFVHSSTVVATTVPPPQPPPKTETTNVETSSPPSKRSLLERHDSADGSIADMTTGSNNNIVENDNNNMDPERRRSKLIDNDHSREGSSSNLNNNNNNKPAYSKRRKKPRLAECESKLAQLKAENEQLKRHLQNVSNKAQKLEVEKKEAGKRIAQLLHDDQAGPAEMAAAVREFSDMYSDYGIHRQQELSFHLQQLQRLIDPTNFTKMGLWTMGQSHRDPKRNPIAGILVKELTISPQQGRKILDQSEKIQKLCSNLRETHALLAKLKALCQQKTQIFQDRMSKCTRILTSEQVVKLILWINQHTELLGSICPGWGTEQIISSSSSTSSNQQKPAAKK